MVAETRYLRRRRGRYLVQVAVPPDLRERIGKANVERYLGTSSLPDAKHLRHAAVAEIFETFERARQGGPLRPDEVKAHAEAELRRTYDSLAANFLDAHVRLPEFASMVAEDSSDPVMAALNENPFLGTTAAAYAEELVQRIGAEPTAKTVAELSDAILRAQAAAVEMLHKGMAPPPLDGQPVGRNGSGSAPRITEAGAMYIAERERDPRARPTAQTLFQTRSSFRLFSDYTDDARLDEVTREIASRFLETVGRLHPMYGRSARAKGLALSELLKHFPGPPYLSNRTLNRHQSALKTLFRWCRRKGLVNGENPFADLARPKARQSEVGWRVLTTEEMARLFEGLAFEIRPAQHSLATARPWVMVIALYSGMRQAEITELDAEDVCAADGIPYFDVSEAKSEAGVRRVPIHSELVRLGLLDYAAAIGSGPLFPGITPGGPDRKRAHTFSKRFPEFRRRRGVNRERVSFHSFRKSFVRALEMAKVDRDRAALVIGHERGFTFRVYNPDGLDMAALREVVQAVSYPGLRLKRIE